MSDDSKTTSELERTAGSSPASCSALEQEVERLRKRNSELHRRCQQAEAAVARFKKEWDKHGGPTGGSFGRALLACECMRLEAELKKAQNAPHERRAGNAQR